ncbi:LLM class flavin-dependent oxidoreductase [Amycolatopsis sp. WQ 127309]|uniref:LLM class flavin-dependent oxidoreductase n=1 Tax=Amycolatopsis sp. WQ 127309 TaxID=2932773 RepID=UPI001FF1059A|nr:LLM class flavin-dependent oxidoreductase [Amycolatopsis sp. WQ 127309]UOZ03139.1 LLM class flavin-dependent oxidoreductase [Amycolatopsis sp. WQ 127309]
MTSLHLAVELDGDGARVSPRALADAVTAAESSGFTLVTFDDSPLPPGGGFRLDATGRAAYVSTLTDRAGLAATANVTTAEPFHLAAQLASLDHASRGRAAWIVAADGSAEALATIGGSKLGPAALHREAADVVEAVRRLWDSWDDDAVVKDVATGRYLDPDRVHHVDFTGATFSVKGPLITPRPPQGRPVVLAPDDLAEAVRPDVVLIGGTGLEDVRRRAQRARESGAPLVFAEVEVLLDTDVPAGRRPHDRLRYTGSAAGLTELLGWLATSVDGVRLHAGVHTTGLTALIEEVLPALRKENLLVPPQSGATLRASLGLPRPASVFAAGAA